jgi:xanthine/uracil permease
MATSYDSRTRGRDESTAGLLGRLLDDAAALAKNEIALAKSELRGAIGDFKVGLVSLAMAAVVLLAGVLTLVAAGVIALATVIEWWLAALIVGAALALIGLALMGVSKRNLASPDAQMDKTQSSLHKDATVVARRA